MKIQILAIIEIPRAIIRSPTKKNTILSFNTNDKFVECGARPEHLRNADVVLGEMKEDGNIEFHWERIYPSLLNPVEVNI